MNLKSVKINFKSYFYLATALVVVFWLISLFEIGMLYIKGISEKEIGISLGLKFINDFWAAFLLTVIVLPFYALLSILLKKGAGKIIGSFFVIIVLIQFSLVKYSLTTLLNLGADVLGYSVSDMYLTVTSSEAMSVTYFLPFVVFPLLFFAIYYLINKKITANQLFASLVILTLSLGSLKLVLQNTSAQNSQNKLYFLAEDIIRLQKEKRNAQNYDFSRSDFPYLKSFNKTNDVLKPFFNITEEKPSVVFIIVEGLGAEFTGQRSYSGFTPFIDSLMTKSLNWQNFVSNTGRTFGVLPSILGSLPLGENGFLELETIPSHLTLYSVLKANGYTTSFYGGDPSSFDRKINFLEYNSVDHIIDEDKYGAGFTKTQANDGGFSWGYPDAEIFRKSLSTFDEKKLPRLDVILTLSNHEPFNFPEKQQYLQKVDSMLVSNLNLKVSANDVNTYKDIFATLLYTDTSIKNFMRQYAKRPEYNNTIFIITGDHRLIPISQKDKLCRFHVPFIIYSPLLKKTANFKSVSSHMDVAPSMLSFLMNNYKISKLEQTGWLSKGLDTARFFRNNHQIPLMRYKGNINDFIYKDYLFSAGELYKINENFGTYKVFEKELLKTIADSLQAYKKLNAYVTQKNKIFPDSLNIYVQPRFEFTDQEHTEIKDLTKGQDFDQIFETARNLAFSKNYTKATLVLNYILNEKPNQIDARILKGRLLAWQGKYSESETELSNALKRNPFYSDGYLALLDVYWWSDQDEKSVKIYLKALDNGISNADISFKMAKAYKRLNEKELSLQLIDSLLQNYPENTEFLNFKQTLSNES